jgi:UDP-glucose 4-epimerase
MNILVTGGAGFIGSHTVIALSEAGFTPIIVDNFSNSEKSVLDGIEKILGRTVRCHTIDCNDSAALREVVRTEKIEGVIHFAAFKAVGESMSNPLAYYRNNLGSMLTLLEVMLEAGVGNLIFSSSCTVYGETDTLPVTEITAVKPAASVYGNTKRVGEEILHDVAKAHPIKVIALRYFNPIGAHPSGLIGELPLGIPSNLVPFVTQTAIGLRPSLTVFGNDYPTEDGTCIRDYIHVMDLAEAHVAALNNLICDQRTSLYDVFNIGTGAGNSVLELIKTFEEVTGTPLHYRFGPRRPGDVTAIWGDVHKANNLLGWKARLTLREGLTDAWRWQQQLTERTQ